MPDDTYWWISNGKEEELAQVKEENGRIMARKLYENFYTEIEKKRLLRRANPTGHFCEDCIHLDRPKGGQCGTLTRELKARMKGRVFFPVYVIPEMIEIEKNCKRFKKKEVSGCLNAQRK